MYLRARTAFVTSFISGRVLQDAFHRSNEQCKHYTQSSRMVFTRRFSIAPCSGTVSMPIGHLQPSIVYILFELPFLTKLCTPQSRKLRASRVYHGWLSKHRNHQIPAHCDNPDGVHIACLFKSAVAMQFTCQRNFVLCSWLVLM